MGLWHPPTSKASENLKRPHSSLWDLSGVVRKLSEDGFDGCFGLPTPRLALIFPLATKVASLLFRLATWAGRLQGLFRKVHKPERQNLEPLWNQMERQCRSGQALRKKDDDISMV